MILILRPPETEIMAKSGPVAKPKKPFKRHMSEFKEQAADLVMKSEMSMTEVAARPPPA